MVASTISTDLETTQVRRRKRATRTHPAKAALYVS
jgi:hypothetical protein